MSNYIGVRCPVCNKKFTEADDVVVCPVCGAPHHRECYMQSGQCAFVSEHLSGSEWSDPGAQQPEQGDGAVRACTRCGALNPPDRIFCQVCGGSLAANQPPPSGGPDNVRAPYPPYTPPYRQGLHMDAISMAYGGLSPDETIEEESVQDLARYIGSGSAYYLPRFRMFNREKRVVSINLSAFLFGYYYFFYRKMYRIGVLLLILSILSSIPFYIRTYELVPLVPYFMGLGAAVEVNQSLIDQMGQLGNITNFIYIGIKIVVSILANHLYYTRVIRDVHAIRIGAEAEGNPQRCAEALTHAGGVNRNAVIMVIILFIMMSFIISGVMVTLQA